MTNRVKVEDLYINVETLKVIYSGDWQCLAKSGQKVCMPFTNPNSRSFFEILKRFLQANMRAMPKTKDPWEQIFLKCCHPFDKCLKYNFVTPSTKLLTQMLPAVFTSLLQYAFKIYLMGNIKRMLGTDFALTVCKMSSSNSKEFGMHSFLIGIASPHI
jgi:hypothetical protein